MNQYIHEAYILLTNNFTRAELVEMAEEVITFRNSSPMEGQKFLDPKGPLIRFAEMLSKSGVKGINCFPLALQAVDWFALNEVVRVHKC